MLIVGIPYCKATEGNPRGLDLGLAHNRFFDECLEDDDWGLVLDHDMSIMTPGWFGILSDLIRDYPEASLIVGTLSQALPKSAWQVRGGESGIPGHDIARHIEEGMLALDSNCGPEDVTQKGVTGDEFALTGMMCLSKRTWRDVGGFPGGQLFVDWGMHERVRNMGKKVILCRHIYVYHWLRGQGA